MGSANRPAAATQPSQAGPCASRGHWRSTGGDALGSDAAPSAEQVAASDTDWEQAVDQAVTEVRRAADNQADPPLA